MVNISSPSVDIVVKGEMTISQKIVDVLPGVSILQIIIALIIPFTYFIRYIKASKVEIHFTPLYKRIWIVLSLIMFTSVFFSLAFSIKDIGKISINDFKINILIAFTFAVFLVIATYISAKLFSASAGIKFIPKIYDDSKKINDNDWEFLKSDTDSEYFLFKKKVDSGIEYKFVSRDSCRIIEEKTRWDKIVKEIYSTKYTFWMTILLNFLLMYVFYEFLKVENEFFIMLLTLFILVTVFSSTIVLLRDYNMIQKRKQ